MLQVFKETVKVSIAREKMAKKSANFEFPGSGIAMMDTVKEINRAAEKCKMMLSHEGHREGNKSSC
jgi:hypothetical protein